MFYVISHLKWQFICSTILHLAFFCTEYSIFFLIHAVSYCKRVTDKARIIWIHFNDNFNSFFVIATLALC